MTFLSINSNRYSKHSVPRYILSVAAAEIKKNAANPD